MFLSPESDTEIEQGCVHRGKYRQYPEKLSYLEIFWGSSQQLTGR